MISTTRFNMVITAMVACLLFSAFGVIYLKDLNRRLFIQYDAVQQQAHRSDTEWGKLLLEQSTWSTQSRIQSVASLKLGMLMPHSNDIVMVERDVALAKGQTDIKLALGNSNLASSYNGKHNFIR